MKKIYMCIVLIIPFLVQGQDMSLEYLGGFSSGLFDEGAMEIVVHDPTSQRLFATNSATGQVDIFSFTDPTDIQMVSSVDFSNFGDGVNSVAVSNGILAAAVEGPEADSEGMVVFFDADGNILSAVQVGILPDMVTFTPDGSKLLVACEAEPADDYSVDGPGTVGIIDLSNGVEGLGMNDATILDFSAFDGNLDPDVRVFGPGGESFESFQDFQDNSAMLGEWTSFSVSSDNDWFYDSFMDDFFAEMNGFGADAASNDWLISPSLSYTSATFSFENTRNFSGGSLDVLISTDYDGAGNPEDFTWDTLNEFITFSPGDFGDTPSGDIDITPWASGSTYIAFKYISSGGEAGEGALWQIDDIRIVGEMGSSLASTDLEPEYIAISESTMQAYVALQEANAIAIVDLMTDEIIAVAPLGFKDHSIEGNGFDASNRSDAVDIKTHPVFGMYQPDAITVFESTNGTYVLTANEGDSRDYDAFSEEARVEDVVLDPDAFPNAAELQTETELGRLKITTTLGDTDGDGDYDELYAYGARSFSIWQFGIQLGVGNEEVLMADAELIYDSGDEFAQVLLERYPDQFNSNNDDNDSFKSRSDDKGSEPEAIEIGAIGDDVYAFIGLERMGGIMVYRITDPTAPEFVDYFLFRDFSVPADDPAAGDLGPEDIIFLDATVSPTGTEMIVVANEVSGTIGVYGLGLLSNSEDELIRENFRAYPNPTVGEIKFNTIIEGSIYDMVGTKVMEVVGDYVDLSRLSAGVYVLKTENGISQKIIKE